MDNVDACISHRQLQTAERGEVHVCCADRQTDRQQVVGEGMSGRVEWYWLTQYAITRHVVNEMDAADAGTAPAAAWLSYTRAQKDGMKLTN